MLFKQSTNTNTYRKCGYYNQLFDTVWSSDEMEYGEIFLFLVSTIYIIYLCYRRT